MYKLYNHIPRLIKLGELKENQVKAAVAAAGFSHDTARRLLEGETGFGVSTLASITLSLGREKITDIIDILTQDEIDEFIKSSGLTPPEADPLEEMSIPTGSEY